jgi:hypothetical protein
MNIVCLYLVRRDLRAQKVCPDARHVDDCLFASTLDEERKECAHDVVRPQDVHHPGFPPLLRVRVHDEAERFHVAGIVDDKVHTAECSLDLFGGVGDLGGGGGVNGKTLSGCPGRWAAKQAASVAFRLKRAMPVMSAWADAMAMCSPMPFDAPVTRTTFPARLALVG